MMPMPAASPSRSEVSAPDGVAPAAPERGARSFDASLQGKLAASPRKADRDGAGRVTPSPQAHAPARTTPGRRAAEPARGDRTRAATTGTAALATAPTAPATSATDAPVPIEAPVDLQAVPATGNAPGVTATSDVATGPSPEASATATAPATDVAAPTTSVAPAPNVPPTVAAASPANIDVPVTPPTTSAAATVLEQADRPQAKVAESAEQGADAPAADAPAADAAADVPAGAAALAALLATTWAALGVRAPAPPVALPAPMPDGTATPRERVAAAPPVGDTTGEAAPMSAVPAPAAARADAAPMAPAGGTLARLAAEHTALRGEVAPGAGQSTEGSVATVTPGEMGAPGHGAEGDDGAATSGQGREQREARFAAPALEPAPMVIEVTRAAAAPAARAASSPASEHADAEAPASGAAVSPHATEAPAPAARPVATAATPPSREPSRDAGEREGGSMKGSPRLMRAKAAPEGAPTPVPVAMPGASTPSAATGRGPATAGEAITAPAPSGPEPAAKPAGMGGVDRVTVLVGEGAETARVQVTMHGSQVLARVTSANPAVREALAASAGELRTALEAQGPRAARVEVRGGAPSAASVSLQAAADSRPGGDAAGPQQEQRHGSREDARQQAQANRQWQQGRQQRQQRQPDEEEQA